MSRYARQIALPEIGAQGQARLAAARVLVIGAGGLGSAVLPLLAGAGVGAVAVVDPDVVDETNLHRQTLFTMADIGQPKARVAAARMIAANPDCAATAHVAQADPACLPALMAGADLVVDAADNVALSYAASDACLAAGVGLISASVLGRRGYVGGFCGPAPSLRAVFPDLPAQMGSCNDDGVMGPAVACLGAMQAQMVLAALIGLAPSPFGQVVTVDLAGWRFGGFRFDGAPEPEAAIPAILSPGQISPADLVVDLRLNPAPPRPAPGQRVVFTCKTGLRAWRAAQALAAGGHAEVAIVGDGG